MKIKSLEKRLFSNWMKSETFRAGKFVPDGLVDEEKFLKQKLRFVFIRGTSEDFGMPLDECLRQGVIEKKAFRAWSSICNWIKVEPGRSFTAEERSAILKCIAAVNVDKSVASGSWVDMKRLARVLDDPVYASNLRKQLDFYSSRQPIVFVCCGSGMFDLVCQKVFGVRTDSVDHNKKPVYLKLKDKCWVMAFNDPSRCREDCSELFRDYVKEMTGVVLPLKKMHHANQGSELKQKKGAIPVQETNDAERTDRLLKLERANKLYAEGIAFQEAGDFHNSFECFSQASGLGFAPAKDKVRELEDKWSRARIALEEEVANKEERRLAAKREESERQYKEQWARFNRLIKESEERRAKIVRERALSRVTTSAAEVIVERFDDDDTAIVLRSMSQRVSKKIGKKNFMFEDIDLAAEVSSIVLDKGFWKKLCALRSMGVKNRDIERVCRNWDRKETIRYIEQLAKDFERQARRVKKAVDVNLCRQMVSSCQCEQFWNELGVLVSVVG